MQFNSYLYLVLLAIAVMVFWALPVAARRAYVLLLSVLFYASWTLVYAPLPFVICGEVFLCARMMSARPDRAETALRVGIAFTLSFLIFFKYRPFLVDNLNAGLQLMGQSPVLFTLALALPLGISFYSFEAISYLIDTRQGGPRTSGSWTWPCSSRSAAHDSGPDCARPGARAAAAVQQAVRHVHALARPGPPDRGLVQKNFLANNLASFVEEGFMARSSAANTTVDNWFCAFAFGLHIYFDFALYSNMAIGAAQLVGITLPENFRFPYHASNPSDFWTRWHMTLSRCIRDYLFFPINARFQGAPVPLYLSTVGIMALVGLWHGAGWGFVIWGIMHGFYLRCTGCGNASAKSTSRSRGLARSRLRVAGVHRTCRDGRLDSVPRGDRRPGLHHAVDHGRAPRLPAVLPDQLLSRDSDDCRVRPDRAHPRGLAAAVGEAHLHPGAAAAVAARGIRDRTAAVPDLRRPGHPVHLLPVLVEAGQATAPGRPVAGRRALLDRLPQLDDHHSPELVERRHVLDQEVVEREQRPLESLAAEPACSRSSAPGNAWC